MSDNSKQPTFEQLLADVEDVTRKLQEGAVPLEEALDLYESGFEKLQAAQTRLEAARSRLETLKKSAGDGEDPA